MRAWLRVRKPLNSVHHHHHPTATRTVVFSDEVGSLFITPSDVTTHVVCLTAATALAHSRAGFGQTIRWTRASGFLLPLDPLATQCCTARPHACGQGEES